MRLIEEIIAVRVQDVAHLIKAELFKLEKESSLLKSLISNIKQSLTKDLLDMNKTGLEMFIKMLLKSLSKLYGRDKKADALIQKFIEVLLYKTILHKDDNFLDKRMLVTKKLIEQYFPNLDIILPNDLLRSTNSYKKKTTKSTSKTIADRYQKVMNSLDNDIEKLNKMY